VRRHHRRGRHADHDQADDRDRDAAAGRALGRRRQLGNERGHRREPLRALLRQAAHHGARDRRGQPSIGRRLRLLAFLEHRNRGRARQRMHAVQRFVERDAEAELIAARVDVRAQQLLGRHVARRAEHGAGRGQIDEQRRAVRARHRSRTTQRVGGRRRPAPGIVDPEQRAGEPEIGDTHAAIAADEHVVGFEVAVQQADRVRRHQAARRLVKHLEDLAPRPRPALQPRRQRVALDELHRDVDVLAVRPRGGDARTCAGRRGSPDVVDRDDVRVVELGDRLGLALQARARLFRVRAEVRAQHLERDLAIELGIVRREHVAHAAGAERRQHEVAADAIADRQRRQAAGLRLGEDLALVAMRRGVRVDIVGAGERGDELATIATAGEVLLDLGDGAVRHRAGDELARDVVIQALHRLVRVARVLDQTL